MNAPLKRIQALDQQLSNQIAAGEVVERPGSALKELLENSLDAGATQIRVEIEEGGSELILVMDNGSGIYHADLTLALERHATSKIRTTEDLFAIRSWGFRGEALAAISAVSNVLLSSRHKDADEGREIRAEAGSTCSDKTVTRPVGTTVRVESLFFNTPVRKKFLKSTAGETAYCTQVVNRLALASPEVDWELWIDNKKVLHYPAVKDARDRIVQVFREGLKTKITREELIVLDKQSGDLHVWGYLLPSTALIPSTRGMFLYVNRRSVKDRLLQQAVTNAAREVLFGHSYPQIVLHVDTDPENVDVNVHPTKAEVRFRNGGHLFAVIRSTLEKTLAAQRPTGIFTPGRSGPEVAFGSANLSLDLQAPAMFAQRFSEPNRIPPTQAELRQVYAESRVGPQFLCSLKNTYLLCQDELGLLLVDQHAAHERVTYEKLKAQQFGPNNLQSSRLLIPIILEIPIGSLALLEQAHDALLELGLEFDRIGASQLAIRALPSLLVGTDGAPTVTLNQLFRDLAEELEQSPKEATADVLKNCILEVLASQSCHGSVRAGQTLSALQADALLRSMGATDFAGHCPHGRPTTVRITWTELERMFKRIV